MGDYDVLVRVELGAGGGRLSAHEVREDCGDCGGTPPLEELAGALAECLLAVTPRAAHVLAMAMADAADLSGDLPGVGLKRIRHATRAFERAARGLINAYDAYDAEVEAVRRHLREQAANGNGG